MNTDKIGGRKFAAYWGTMFGWAAVLYMTVAVGKFGDSSAQAFLFFLVAIQTIFFGGNVLDKLISSKQEEKPK